MGLIEADKLIEICRKGWKLFGGEDEKLKHWVDEADIRNQPTVEAIPVEFIRNEIASSIEVVSDEDYDYNYASCLLQLLERWEKEKEKENEKEL